MKKILLGTTALVAGGLLAAPAMAADPIKINVIGYMQSYIGIGGYDKDGTAGTNKYHPVTFRYEGEIWFQGQTKLDNGTTIGLRVELEAWSQGGISYSGSTDTKDTVDEEYIFAFGDWGRIEFGSTDTASYKMTYTTPSALIGHGFVQHNFNPTGGNAAVAANNANHGVYANNPGIMAVDANKFTYYTPRIQGFQVGFSYTPYFKNPNGTGVGAIAGGNAAQCGFLGGGGNTNYCSNNADAFKNGIDLGINYLNKFGDFSVALYGGYAYASFDRGISTTGGNWEAWAVGANFGYMGFTLGGGVGQDNNGLRGSNKTTWYSVGLMYETGPWQASVAWWHGDRKESSAAVAGSGGAAGKDKIDYFQVGANYALGPGVKLVGGFVLESRKGQNKAEGADGWQFLFGTELRF